MKQLNEILLVVCLFAFKQLLLPGHHATCLPFGSRWELRMREMYLPFFWFAFVFLSQQQQQKREQIYVQRHTKKYKHAHRHTQSTQANKLLI